jgi:hypothetical protein
VRVSVGLWALCNPHLTLLAGLPASFLSLSLSALFFSLLSLLSPLSPLILSPILSSLLSARFPPQLPRNSRTCVRARAQRRHVSISNGRMYGSGQECFGAISLGFWVCALLRLVCRLCIYVFVSCQVCKGGGLFYFYTRFFYRYIRSLLPQY